MRLPLWSGFAPSLSRLSPRRRPLASLLFAASAWLTTGLTPAPAAVYATDGLSMAAICHENASQFMPGMYVQAIVAMNLAAFNAAGGALAGDATAAVREAEYRDAMAALRRCMTQDHIARIFVDARRSCIDLRGVHLRFEQAIQVSEARGVPVSRTSLQDSLKPDVDKCWDELTARCIDFNDPAQVQRVSDLLEVAGWAGIPRSYLVPPLTACTKTVPECADWETEETCRRYLTIVGNVLFYGQDLNGLLPQ